MIGMTVCIPTSICYIPLFAYAATVVNFYAALSLSLDLHDWTGVLVSCPDSVVDHCQDQDTTKHGRGPIHVWCSDWNSKWPEGEEP